MRIVLITLTAQETLLEGASNSEIEGKDKTIDSEKVEK